MSKEVQDVIFNVLISLAGVLVGMAIASFLPHGLTRATCIVALAFFIVMVGRKLYRIHRPDASAKEHPP